MKPWPSFPKTINVSDAIEPLLRVINKRDPSEYDGYDIGRVEKQSCSDPDVFLQAVGSGAAQLDSLRARALFVAFWLGMEQSRRIDSTSVPWEMSRPEDCLLLIMSAARRYLEVTGWKANEYTPFGEGPQRAIELAWTSPEGGAPVTYIEALHTVFNRIGAGHRGHPAVTAREALDLLGQRDTQLGAVTRDVDVLREALEEREAKCLEYMLECNAALELLRPVQEAARAYAAEGVTSGAAPVLQAALATLKSGGADEVVNET